MFTCPPWFPKPVPKPVPAVEHCLQLLSNQPVLLLQFSFFFSFFFFSYLTIKYPWGDKQRRTLMHNAVVHYTQVHHCFCCLCGLVQGLGMHLVEVLLWPGAHLSCYTECLQVEVVLEQPLLPVVPQWGQPLLAAVMLHGTVAWRGAFSDFNLLFWSLKAYIF